MSWFNAKRKGSGVQEIIRATLSDLNIDTDPSFESVNIDATIRFTPRVDEAPKEFANQSSTSGVTEGLPDELEILKSVSDPTYRISRLSSANRQLVTVKADTSLNEAITLMMMHNYSQLPVMHSDRDVKGIISWSSISQRLALGLTCKTVRDCMELAYEVKEDESILAAITVVSQHQYVLVRGKDRRITGIVTNSDLGFQFYQLAEPFLLIGEIENQIRLMIIEKFSDQDLKDARDPNDTERVVEGVSDLTFGEYKRLLENPDKWKKLNLEVERRIFVEQLEEIRKIRNDVMHFDPDGLPAKDLDLLRDFVRFLRRIRDLTHIKSDLPVRDQSFVRPNNTSKALTTTTSPTPTSPTPSVRRDSETPVNFSTSSIEYPPDQRDTGASTKQKT
ncbi:MAG TPA: CBS domain-containing protein [Roseiflexaceae bacterium]|nr:CBS domain-containing protein [Roseiflexaceae bacterium]